MSQPDTSVAVVATMYLRHGSHITPPSV